MPSNNVSTIAIYRDANAAAALSLSPQETGIRLSAIPNPSTTVSLPAKPFPNDGDSYVVVDEDGSCSPSNLIIVAAPAGTLIRGLAVFVMSTPFASAVFTFDASRDSWTVEFISGGTSPVLSDALWVDVPAGTTLAPTDAQQFLSCDSSAAQTTINLASAAAAVNGQIVLVRATGNMLSPVIVNAGAGTTVELLNAPGTFGASTWLPIQGQGAFFKYDLATTTWKAWSTTGGSGAPGTSAYNVHWFTQTDIYLDPQAGVDSAAGTVGFPVKDLAELVRRYGGNTPTLPYGQSLTVHLLSAQTAATDPVFFKPKVSGGGQLILDCRAAWVAAGAAYAIGALSGGYGYAGAVPTAGGVEMTQAGPPGYVTPGVLLHNTARASYAFADTATTIGQPQTVASLTTTTGSPTPVVDNDWVAGDNVEVFTLPLLNLKDWGAVGGDAQAGGQASSWWVIGANIADPSGAGTSEFAARNETGFAVLSLCKIDPRCTFTAQQGRAGPLAMCCYFTGAPRVMSGQATCYGCVLKNGFNLECGQLFFTNNTVIHGAGTIQSNYFDVLAGQAFADGTLSYFGATANIFGIFWGSYAITLNPGSSYINNTGSTFVLKALLTTGALKIGTATTGSTYTGAGVMADGVNITPANIDAGGAGGAGIFNPRTGARFCNTQ